MGIQNLDLDVQMSQLEADWRQAYEASITARGDYQALAAEPGSKAYFLDMARERLDRAEALKARILVQIERLESELLGKD